MKCAKARDLFSSYLESEMDVPTSLQFEQHLAECHKCKADYDRMNAAVMMLDEMPEVEVPADFHASVMARVEQLRGTTPSPVKWWQIDWQHVFTLRVPARAAALAVVALLVVAVLAQVTPVGTGVMNLLGLQRVSQKLVTVQEPETAPSWQLKSGDAVYDMRGSGLMIGVTSQVEESGRIYALRLQSRSAEPVEFVVQTGERQYDGSVVRNQDSIIHVPVGASSDLAVAEVKWTYQGKRHTQYIFLPQKFDPQAHLNRLTMQFDNATYAEVLQRVAKAYGVVILASGDLQKVVPAAYVSKGNPAEVLYHAIEESGADMKQEVLAPSIYVVEPAK